MASTSHKGLKRLLRVAAATAAAVSLFVTAGCSSSGTADASGDSSNQTLTIGTVNSLSGLNVFTATDIAALWALGFSLDTLLVQPTALDFQPKLASSFESDDSQTFTVTLNSDAKWTDGEAITSDDVLFTLNLMANPAATYKASTYITALEGVDSTTGKLPEGTATIPDLTKVDDQTFTFKTKEPVDQNYIKEMLGTKIMILPEHVLADVDPSTIDTSDFATQPTVFSGPYKITNYTESTSVEYEANDDYYLGAPQVKNIVMKIMPAANLAGELQAGTITMNSGGGIGNIPFTDLETVQGLTNVTTNVNPSIGFQTMEFNTTNSALSDKRVRQAFAMAINRQQIVDELLKGQGEVIDGPYSSANPYLDTDLTVTPYDPDQAKALLEEAGYDFDTTINFVIPTGNSVREQSADIIMQNLEAIGVKISAAKYDFPTTLSMMQKGEFDISLIGFTFNMDPDVTVLYGPGSTYNFTGWSTDENTSLLQEGKSTADEDERHDIYNQLQEIWQDEMPILTLYSNYEIESVSNTFTINGADSFWNGMASSIYEWHFVSGAE